MAVNGEDDTTAVDTENVNMPRAAPDSGFHSPKRLHPGCPPSPPSPAQSQASSSTRARTSSSETELSPPSNTDFPHLRSFLETKLHCEPPPPPPESPPPQHAGSDHSEQSPPQTPEPDPPTVQPEPGKMFVGGLSPITTAESLREYFERFGAIRETTVMRDPNNNRSRGFGFVTFEDPASVTDVLNSRPHQVDSKAVDPKMAVPKTNSRTKYNQNESRPFSRTPEMSLPTVNRKVFVGGVAERTTKDQMHKYFAQYGQIELCALMMDRETNRHRGFGFVTYEKAEDAAKVCKIHYHTLDEKKVEVKYAVPKDQLRGRFNATNQLAGQNAYDFIVQLMSRNFYNEFLPNGFFWTENGELICQLMSINVDPFGNYLVYYNPPPAYFPAYPTISPVPVSNHFQQAMTGFNIPQGQANPDAYTYLTGYYIHANDFAFSPNIYAAPQFWNGYPAIQN
ncbi:unnamed protein product [Hymenolepis diminuta]|uniref:RRM domain-containing protein n=1 Tax=Hymenolepis diminuta TaxID=6216 RepID=A0A564Z259_HYMDI|nr:unnamed protein product [Hymenolepis diminuta]